MTSLVFGALGTVVFTAAAVIAFRACRKPSSLRLPLLGVAIVAALNALFRAVNTGIRLAGDAPIEVFPGVTEVALSLQVLLGGVLLMGAMVGRWLVRDE